MWKLWILLFSISLFSQNDQLFKVDINEIKMGDDGNGFYSLEPSSDFFYEDDFYTVTDSCRGEFGGNIYFKDKKTDVQYSFKATCPVIINKINDSYYLTTSLAHLIGFCELYEISNPKELVDVTILDFYDYKKSKSVIGGKLLINETGMTILLSFVFKEKLYHIVSNHEETFIAERENAELKKIQNLTDFRMTSYGNEAYKTVDNVYTAIFQAKRNQGYVVVDDNKIQVNIYIK